MVMLSSARRSFFAMRCASRRSARLAGDACWAILDTVSDAAKSNIYRAGLVTDSPLKLRVCRSPTLRSEPPLVLRKEDLAAVLSAEAGAADLARAVAGEAVPHTDH